MDSQVSCLMDANPASDLTFKWKFNTTSNTVDIPVTFFLEDLFKMIWFSYVIIVDIPVTFFLEDLIQNDLDSVMFNKNVNMSTPSTFRWPFFCWKI